MDLKWKKEVKETERTNANGIFELPHYDSLVLKQVNDANVQQPQCRSMTLSSIPVNNIEETSLNNEKTVNVVETLSSKVISTNGSCTTLYSTPHIVQVIPKESICRRIVNKLHRNSKNICAWLTALCSILILGVLLALCICLLLQLLGIVVSKSFVKNNANISMEFKIILKWLLIIVLYIMLILIPISFVWMVIFIIGTLCKCRCISSLDQ